MKAGEERADRHGNLFLDHSFNVLFFLDESGLAPAATNGQSGLIELGFALFEMHRHVADALNRLASVAPGGE